MSLTRRIALASVLLAVLVGGAFAVLIAEIQSLRESNRLARRAAEVTATAHKLERMAIDLQTGIRGFTITGQEHFLDPWRNAREEIPGTARELDGLIVDRRQKERAREIVRMIEEYDEVVATRVVETARSDLARARAMVATGSSNPRMNAIRARFADFFAAERAIAARRNADADADARRAIVLGAWGLFGSGLLILVFASYLARAVVGPVKRVSSAAGRLRSGDLSARVPDVGGGEVGELGRAFNAMAASLEESRDELERQNSEFESQTAELEDRQAELANANDELLAQRAELERALDELAVGKRRVDAFYAVGEALARETDLQELAATVLRELGDFAEADLGSLYLADDGDGTAFRLAAARGIEDTGAVPPIRPGVGLPGRALAERRPVAASYGEAGLRLAAFGEEVPVQHELHLPLLHEERALGVLTVARAGARPYDDGDVKALQHLAEQAAVAVANALALRESRRLAHVNQAVLDATVDGIRLVDPEGNTVVANAAIERMAKDLLALPDDGTIYDRVGALADRTTDPDGYRAEMRAVMEDPDYEGLYEYHFADTGRWVQRYTKPVRDANGLVLGRLFVVREITAEREAERLKSELVATVSHELRTPLASILGFSELLAHRGLEAETSKRYIRTIHGEAKRLTELINDFLDLQRMEEGRFRLTIEAFELDELLREQVEVFSGQSSAHALALELPPEGLLVAGDRDRVAQVVGNLISNAIKYSPDGGRVEVGAEATDGVVRVSVRDEGLGIPSAQQAKIFTKFFRVDTSDTRAIGGTGLGLALCREIVEAHGGKIGFDSVPGAGSTFWFELPAAARSRRDGGRSALVIEDDPAGAALLSDYLAEDGFAVEVAATGEEGLERAEREPPTLICLDIRLAGELDGWDVLARLKADTATAAIPVVVCTAGNGRDEAAALGVADFLAKPFSAAHLRETLARVLPQSSGSILVVDDEPVVRALVRETLSGNGLEVREAGDGEEALGAVAARTPDAIVLDMMMPTLDGFAVLERLQRDPATRSIPVVVLTAQQLSGEERNFLQARAVSLLEKTDYSAAELRRLVRRALGEKPLHHAEQL